MSINHPGIWSCLYEASGPKELYLVSRLTCRVLSDSHLRGYHRRSLTSWITGQGYSVCVYVRTYMSVSVRTCVCLCVRVRVSLSVHE